MSFDNPHCKVPFTFGAFVEQDSRDEVIQNIWSILSYELGEREDLPEFGVRDQTLREGGADLSELQRAILKWEPRARFVIEHEPDLLSTLIDRIQVRLEGVNG